MPKEEKMVDLDTSGEGAEVNLEEKKDESVVETEAPKQETEAEAETEAPKEEQVETKQEEVKEEPKKEDEKLEDYSKGVQARIAKLTRKMREAERQRDAATEYARSVEEKRKVIEKRFEKTDADYIKKFETSINTGLEAAQKELAAAIQAGDAEAQVAANKRIATLAFENAKLEQSKSAREEQVFKPADVKAPEQPKTQLQEPSDPRAENWASNNPWFGQDRAMTYTAFEIHKDLVDKEGFDPQSDEYYAEVDKRIRVDFPHKFAKTETKQTAEPVQTVASDKRTVKPGRKTVKLTSSHVAIAKKLSVPLEEYAKQLKNTGGA